MATIAGIPVALLGKILQDRAVHVDKFVSIRNKKNEAEDAVLLVTDHSVVLLKPNGKLIADIHLLDIKALESKTTEELTITGRTASWVVKSPAVDEILSHIRVEFAKDFPGFGQNFAFKLQLSPPSRSESYSKYFPDFNFNDVAVGPCGGLSRTYRAFCLFHNSPAREDIIWDVDNILFANGVKDFNAAEIDDIENSKDIVPLLSALEGNKWFTSFQLREIKLHPDAHANFIQMVSNSTTLTRIELVNIGAGEKFFVSLGESLTKNSSLPLHVLDLSNNNIEEKGVIAVASLLQASHCSIGEVRLSQTGITKKAAVALGAAMKKNLHLLESLTTLDISGNPNIGPEGMTSISEFLAQPNNIKQLNIANTNPNLDAFFGALVRGCTQHLTRLNISGNRFLKKGGSQQGFEQFFSSCVSIKEIDFSATKLPHTYLEALLSKIGLNSFVTDVHLSLRDNDYGPLTGSVLQTYLPKVFNVAGLDLSDNELGDDGFIHFVSGLKENTSVTSLKYERNFKVRSKIRDNAMQALAAALSSNTCKLEDLSLSYCQLKGDIIVILDAVGANDSLLRLDISGNQCGDKGTYALSKALQINKKLETLLWDYNSPTVAGYSAFAIAMTRNSTVKNMPMPMFDLLASMKINEQRTQQLMKSIQYALASNQSPNRLVNASDLEKSQGKLLNSSQQEALDHLISQIKRQQSQFSEKKSEQKEHQQVISEMQVAISNVERYRTLLGQLHGTMDGVQSLFHEALLIELEQFFGKLSNVSDAYFQRAAAEMVSHIVKSFHFSESEATQLNLVLQVGGLKMEKGALEGSLKSAISSEVDYRAIQSFASVASTVSNFVFERLLTNLEGILERSVSVASEDEVAKPPPAEAKMEEAPEIPLEPPADDPQKSVAAAANKKKNRQSRRIDLADLTGGITTEMPTISEASRPVSSESPIDISANVQSAAEGVTLVHYTRMRPTQQGRRLPTRALRQTLRDAEESSDEPVHIRVEVAKETAPPVVAAPRPQPSPKVERKSFGEKQEQDHQAAGAAAEKKELERKEAEKKELERKEAEKKELERKEAEKKELERKEAEKKELEHREAEKKELERKEAEKKELERKETEKKELERKEAEKKELERKEVEKKEVERKEAEKKEFERKEAEKKEAERKEAERKEQERKEAEKKNAHEEDTGKEKEKKKGLLGGLFGKKDKDKDKDKEKVAAKAAPPPTPSKPMPKSPSSEKLSAQNEPAPSVATPSTKPPAEAEHKPEPVHKPEPLPKPEVHHKPDVLPKPPIADVDHNAERKDEEQPAAENTVAPPPVKKKLPPGAFSMAMPMQVPPAAILARRKKAEEESEAEAEKLSAASSTESGEHSEPSPSSSSAAAPVPVPRRKAVPTPAQGQEAVSNPEPPPQPAATTTAPAPAAAPAPVPAPAPASAPEPGGAAPPPRPAPRRKLPVPDGDNAEQHAEENP